MGKAEMAKSMAAESSEKDIDHIKALMGIAQAGKLGEIETLVTRVSIWADEIESARHLAMGSLREAQSAARRVEEITAQEVKKANEKLEEAMKRVNSVVMRLEEVAKRPAWVTYAIVAMYSMLGAAVMAGVLYFVLPNYDIIVKNQMTIFKSVEELKRARSPR